MRKLIGVVGGLGPLASTRFLSTIYRQFRDVPEQQTPRIVVLERFVSLLDLAVDAGLASQGRILLLCTNGTRKLRLFEGARKWVQLADRVSYPADAEQPAVHEILYDLKKNCDPVDAYERLTRLLHGHDVDQWLLGCTELHLLSNVRAGDRSEADVRFKLLDPLQRAAELIRDDALSGYSA